MTERSKEISVSRDVTMPASSNLDSGFVNLFSRARELSGTYQNVILYKVNDHVVRLSMMTEPFHWHQHPDSDEVFIGVEGTLVLEVEEQRLELRAGEMFTVPRGVRHRTRPLGERSVNLTIELGQMTTIRCET